MAIRNGALVSELKDAIADVDVKPEIVVGDEGTIQELFFFSADSVVVN